MCEFPSEVKNICCIGAGYVGGPTMAVIAEKCPDINVTVVDVDTRKIHAWQDGPLPIKEPQLERVVNATRDKNLFFSLDIKSNIEKADVIFIAVGTPTKTAGTGAGLAAQLAYAESAAKMIGQFSKGPKVVVEKSTVPIGYSRSLIQVIKANAQEGAKFEIVSNPEFLAEGTAINDLYAPDRVVIGSDTTSDGRCAADLVGSIYAHWVPEERIVKVNIWSSELVKLAANAFLAQRISSINAISQICEAAGADVEEVSRALGMDSRIGPKFLKASVGFGGSCFQKDVLNLSYISDQYGLKEIGDYWRSIVGINELQRKSFFDKILRQMFHSLQNKRICVLGFAFKADTGDTRESSAITIIKYLLDEGANVAIYDPQVAPEQMFADLKEASALITDDVIVRKVKTYETAYDAAKGADALVVLTEWKEFRELDYNRIYERMGRPAFVFDGRNILDRKALKEIGFRVHNIGVCPHDE